MVRVVCVVCVVFSLCLMCCVHFSLSIFLKRYAVLHLRQLYLRIGIQKHETTIQQIVFKYVRKHDLLEALVERLEKRYSKQQGIVAEYLYPVLAGERSLLQGKGWPNEKKIVVKGVNQTNLVKQEELGKLKTHKVKSAETLKKKTHCFIVFY